MYGRFTDLGLTILRVGTAALMLTHGIPKLRDFDTLAQRFPDPLGIGSELSLSLVVGAEFACSILLLLGLLTRIAAVPLFITMVVAAFVVHFPDPWAKKELPILYAIAFATIALTGPGAPSLDAWFKDRIVFRRRR